MLGKIPVRSLAILLGGGLACMVLHGCGGGPDLPPVVPVSGTVTLDGKTLPRGTVQFVPDASKGTKGATAVGNIDSSGRYTLKTAGVEGAIIGHHKVGVRAETEAEDEATSPAPRPPEPLIPVKYFSSDKSGLQFEVKAGEDNVIDLKLTSRP